MIGDLRNRRTESALDALTADPVMRIRRGRGGADGRGSDRARSTSPCIRPPDSDAFQAHPRRGAARRLRTADRRRRAPPAHSRPAHAGAPTSSLDPSPHAHVTAQIPDTIIIRGQEYLLASEPLERCRARPGRERPSFTVPHSACRRGYVASCEILDGGLYLCTIEGTLAPPGTRVPGPADHGRPATLAELFPAKPSPYSPIGTRAPCGRGKASWSNTSTCRTRASTNGRG